MKLRTRIVLAVLGATAVALVLAGFVARQAVKTEFATVVDVEIDDRDIDVIDEWIMTKQTPEGVEPILEDFDNAYELRMILTDDDEVVVVDTRPEEDLPPLSDLPAYQFVLEDQSQTWWLFTVAIERTTSDDTLANLDRSFVFAGIGSLVIAGLIGLWLANLISGPVRGLSEAVNRMSDGQRDARAPDGGPGEIGVLAGSFNDLADDLERSESSRRTMLADASHELRTPLANLKGHLEGIVDGVVEPDEQTITGLVGDVDRLGGLVDDLQSLSLAEAGALRLNMVPADPMAILGRNAAAHSGRAAAEGVTISVAAAGDLPNVAVDSLRIDQVLGNLVSNAMRYGDEVVLGARLDSHIGDGSEMGDNGSKANMVAFTVTDNGPGIPPDQLELIFERFHRTDASRDRATGGGGLGLAIVAQLVRLHGGEVFAESSRTGTTFTVRLREIS